MLSISVCEQEGINDAIIKMLKLRDARNKKKGGRKYNRLSTAAQTTLINGCAGKSFWQRFDAKHPDLIRRRVSNVSLKRVLACTKDMAISHLDSLAEELIFFFFFMHFFSGTKHPREDNPNLYY